MNEFVEYMQIISDACVILIPIIGLILMIILSDTARSFTLLNRKAYYLLYLIQLGSEERVKKKKVELEKEESEEDDNDKPMKC